MIGRINQWRDERYDLRFVLLLCVPKFERGFFRWKSIAVADTLRSSVISLVGSLFKEIGYLDLAGSGRDMIVSVVSIKAMNPFSWQQAVEMQVKRYVAEGCEWVVIQAVHTGGKVDIEPK